MTYTTPEIVGLARQAWPVKATNGTNKRTVLARFLSMLCFDFGDCWYFKGCHCTLGYGQFRAVGEVKAHRVSWRLFVGEIPDGMMVLHKCDVRCCVNPDHLFLGTQTDNMRDMAAKHRGATISRPGEANPMATLSNKVVLEMRELRKDGLTYAQIADRYGVAAMTSWRAINRKSWVNV